MKERSPGRSTPIYLQKLLTQAIRDLLVMFFIGLLEKTQVLVSHAG